MRTLCLTVALFALAPAADAADPFRSAPAHSEFFRFGPAAAARFAGPAAGFPTAAAPAGPAFGSSFVAPAGRPDFGV